MHPVLILTVSACLLSLLITPVIRDWSLRLGLVDHPDETRKIHKTATPWTGGVAILLSYLGAFALLLLLPLNEGKYISGNLATIGRLFPPVAVIFGIGLLDDWLKLMPWQKLAGQALAAIWAYAAGVRMLGIAMHPIPPWFSFVFTVAWLMVFSNAFNLIDGVDGLAAGVALTATLTIFVAGVLHSDSALGLATAPLAGCLLGFLRYNFNPASIFLGDSGSLSIGFLLGCCGIIWSQKAATMLGVAAPAMALALPLLEVVSSIVRRCLRNEPIFAGDRGHMHHRLLDRGLTPRGVSLLLYAACGVGATLSLLQSVVLNHVAGIVIVLCGGATWVVVHYLSYAGSLWQSQKASVTSPNKRHP